MSNMSKKKILSKKRLQMEARKKILQQKESQQTEKKTALKVSAVAEDTLVMTHEAAPTIAESTSSDDIEHLLKKIKMEITFSDDSTINKEIVISGNELSKAPTASNEKTLNALHPETQPEELKDLSPPEETKIPWVTVAVLAFIVCASLVTGIIHWYNAYYLPPDAVDPGHVIADPVRTPDANLEQTREDETDAQPHDTDIDPDPPETSRRYAIEPLPEFLLLWDEHDNEDIVAILTLGETEIPVVQSNDNAFYITHDINGNLSPLGWVFLDYQVDLYIGMEHNMVIYDPTGEFLRSVMQEFAEYDFFLRNPMISLSTLFGELEWEIFSYYIAPSDFPFAIVDHPDDDIWGETVEQFTLASLYNAMLDVTMYDQVLTIVVPTTVNPELFYILQARMLRQITS